MASEAHTVGPREDCQHTHTVILLHGRDSGANEFAAELFESEASHACASDRTFLGLYPGVRWVFPSAPRLPSERFGVTLSQWFDMWSVEEPEERGELQQDGLRQSIDMILQVIHEELKLVPRSRVILGGISQGFATALLAFLVDELPLGGLIGFCSWMPFATDIESGMLPEFLTPSRILSNVSCSDIIKATPILIEHASDDDVVPLANGKRMAGVLQKLGFQVEWREYRNGGHWLNEPEGVDDICSFLDLQMIKE